MGRRPAGTGPKRGEGTWANLTATSSPPPSGGGAIAGLVAYGSDDDDDDDEQEGPLPEGWQELVDQERQATYYWNSVTMETTWIRPKPVQKKKRKQIESESAAKQDDDDEDDEEARRAAVEAEDLFRSLENELLGQTASNGEKEPDKQEEDEVAMVIKYLTEEEVKKLSGSSNAEVAAELRAVGEAVGELCQPPRCKDRGTQARLWKLEARLEDWRDGLLPSSSLVNRLRELAKWVEEQRPPPPTEAMEAEADPTAAAAETPSTSASPAPSSPTASVDGQDGAAVAAMEEEGEMKAEPAKPEEESAAAASTTSSEAKPKWSAVWDPTHQAYYYYNTETGVTTWDTPPSMGQEAAAGNGAAAGELQALPFVESSTLIVYAGEHPEVTSAAAVVDTFPGCGRRDVRELGVNYYCCTFSSPEAAALAVRVTNEGMDGAIAVETARASWVRGRAGTFVRYPLAEDQPGQLGRVAVSAKAADKEGEQDAQAYVASLPQQPMAEASAPVLKSGSTVVEAVVARGPQLRKSAVASRGPR